MKKLITLLLAVIMLLSLTACGGPNNDDNKDDDKIVVGCYMPLTGATAAAGLDQLNGVKMAIDACNAAGGINGKQIELLYYDDTGTSEGAVKAATRLIEQDGVKIIIGSSTSGNILAVSAVCEEAKVMQVGTGTGSTWTNIGLSYTYRATSNGNLPIATMATQVKDFGYKNVALLSVMSEFGQSGHDSIVDSCKKNGIEIVADITFQSNETDFSGPIANALAAKPEAMIVYGVGYEEAMVTKQLRQNGYTGLIFTTEGATDAQMLNTAQDAANGVVFAATYVVPATAEEGATQLIRDVLADCVKTYGAMPYCDQFYRGYDQACLVIEALKNSKDVNDGTANMEAFRAIKGFTGLGGDFDFTGATGDGLANTSKWMILDGKIQEYDKAALEAWRP